jgi:hypothetical protein
MTREQQTDAEPPTTCPKQPWVMLTFSDDEALAPGTELPAGLRFHLSRCPSCRAIAERLSAVTMALDGVAGDRFDDELAPRATSRVRAALFSGARLTGRVVVDDVPDAWSVDLSNNDGALSSWSARPFFALAACVVLAVGLVAMWRLVDRPGPRSAQFTVDSWRIPAGERESHARRARDLPGPPLESNAGLDASDDVDASPADPVYALAPDDTSPVHRYTPPGSASVPASVPPGADAFFSERFLDKPASAMSTANSTKDRQ